MKRLMAMTAAAVAFAGVAIAQETRRGPDVEGSVGPSAIGERLEQAATRFRQQGKTLDRIVETDMYAPKDRAEYDGLGGNAIVLLSAVSQTKSELPLRRVYISIDGRETDLVAIDGPKLDGSVPKKAADVIGRYRQDRFYLAPVALLNKQGFIGVDWAANRSGFRAFTLPSGEREWMRSATLTPASRPDPAALNAVLAREYAGYALTGNAAGRAKPRASAATAR